MHAPVAEFGTSMCLTPGCDCEGTRAQVAAMVAERTAATDLEHVVAAFTRILRTQREPEDQARQLVQMLALEFKIERRRHG
jgi:hypothetical protein